MMGAMSMSAHTHTHTHTHTPTYTGGRFVHTCLSMIHIQCTHTHNAPGARALAHVQTTPRKE